MSAIDTTDNVVFITIDDGAVRDPAVVAYLREKGWPVSIFPTQQFLDADPAFFQELHGLGATIENHSISHPDLRTLSRAEQQRQICGPVDPIRQRFGAAPRLFRPPYGVYNPTTIEVAGSCGYDAIVLWRADVWEGNMDVQSGDLRAGDIVLFHFRPDLLRSLQAFDRYMAERQLRPGRLEQYLPAAVR